MRILILGSGGREHAMARALATAASEPQVELYCGPGNPGIAELATILPLSPTDPPGVVAAARRQQINLVIPGPEKWLCAGIADALAAADIACCGPSAAAAQLESSKAFTRLLTAPLGVPGPRFAIVRDPAQLRQTIADWEGVPVIKADSLAAGKGVFLPDDKAACLEAGTALLAGALGSAGQTVVVEERLQGEEASLFYACHGEHCIALPHARDHKRLLDGDQGPNTGGMGAISPSPAITAEQEQLVRTRIVLPTLRELVRRGTPFVGFLFVGLMLCEGHPQLLEFNVRLGDPEAQAILPRLAPGEFLRLCQATAAGRLADFVLRVDEKPTCAIVLASAGYPDTPQGGEVIAIDPATRAWAKAWLLHGGTEQRGPELITAGGRVLTVVAQDESADAARRRAYRAADAVRFAGLQRRSDIGLSSGISQRCR